METQEMTLSDSYEFSQTLFLWVLGTLGFPHYTLEDHQRSLDRNIEAGVDIGVGLGELFNDDVVSAV